MIGRPTSPKVAGPLRVLQAFLPHLERAGGGRVLMISSGMGLFSGKGSGAVAYRASKAALNKATQTLAIDLAARGVHVAACHPGWVRTDMGGPGADIAPTESARGLVDLVERLGPTQSGRFFDRTGEARDW